jgi:hypothetical protein
VAETLGGIGGDVAKVVGGLLGQEFDPEALQTPEMVRAIASDITERYGPVVEGDLPQLAEEIGEDPLAYLADFLGLRALRGARPATVVPAAGGSPAGTGAAAAAAEVPAGGGLVARLTGGVTRAALPAESQLVQMSRIPGIGTAAQGGSEELMKFLAATQR